MSNTSKQYDEVVKNCSDIFLKKMKDYGVAWRILRPSSITDQLFIKAQRLRTIQEKGTQKIEDNQEAEFIGLVNYSVMGLIQLEKGAEENFDVKLEDAEGIYKSKLELSKKLMLDKNHDYGEAWRDMRVSSLTDLILMKLLRIKQIEDNKGKTIISEGIDANYLDIINYAIFAMILLNEK